MNLLQRTVIFVPAVFLVVGCATAPVEPDLAAGHPASPDAPESPLPARSGTLALEGAALPPAPKDDETMGMRHGMHHHGDSTGTDTPSTRPGENAAPSAPRVTPTTAPSTAPAQSAHQHDHDDHGGHQ
jgi:hypothetical protein